MNTLACIRFALAASLLLTLTACASGTLLPTDYLHSHQIDDKGTFDLILYGGRNVHDLKTVAILDRDGDPYTIVPFGAEYFSRRLDNLPLPEAFSKGEQFIANSLYYSTTEIKVIKGPDGSIIGYELRPLYMSLYVGGTGDVLSTAYLLKKDNTVVAYITRSRQVHRLFDEDDFDWRR